MEVSRNKYQQNEGPRELEIFSDEQVEEVMESLEYFKSKIEQLQSYCEQVNQKKLRSDEAVLEQKRKHQAEISKYLEEVNLLRSINIQLMSGKVASPEKRGNFSVSSLSCAIDSENAESRIQEMESKVRSLELALAEKEKHVTVMEWQIMDLEATIAALQAERDQFVLELELRDAHENVVQDNEHFGTVGQEGGGDDYHEFERHEEAEPRRKTKTRSPRRPHSDLWGGLRPSESLTLKQMLHLSADWSNKESPLRTRKPPQRHFSDYVKRDSRARNADFPRSNTTHSLEDFDNLSEVDSGLGLGRLTRTTNFCDILDADEYSNFHVADNRLSFTADSLLEQAGNGAEPGVESSRDSLGRKWETFEGGVQNGEAVDGTISENGSKDAVVPEDAQKGEPLGKTGAFDEQSLGSSTSDFSSAFHSSQDILVSSTEEPWSPSSPASCSAIPAKKKLSKKDISKSDSCLTTSRSPPSDKEDMWNFTPDSILNVSTGEILAPSIVETPPTPSLKKSQSFTSSVEIVLKPPRPQTTSTVSTEEDKKTSEDLGDNRGHSEDKKEEELETPRESESIPASTECAVSEEPVTLRNNSGENLRAKHYRKSKSVSMSVKEAPAGEGEVMLRHQKSLSDPVRDDERTEPLKLIEYQKWRKYGRRGKPPGDLKISDC